MNTCNQIFQNFIRQIMLNPHTVLHPTGRIGCTSPAPFDESRVYFENCSNIPSQLQSSPDLIAVGLGGDQVDENRYSPPSICPSHLEV